MEFGFFDISSVLVWPEIITVLILPYIFVSVALALLMNKLNIFKSSINWPLGFVLGAVTIPIIVNLSFIVGRAALFFIGPLKYWAIKGAILGVGLLGTYHFLFPILMGFL